MTTFYSILGWLVFWIAVDFFPAIIKFCIYTSFSFLALIFGGVIIFDMIDGNYEFPWWNGPLMFAGFLCWAFKAREEINTYKLTLLARRINRE